MSANDIEETTTGKRDRKQTTFFAVEAIKTPKKAAAGIAGEGNGVMLGDLDIFNELIAKQRGDSDVVKHLHSLLYGSQGKKTETKKNLRNFNGFPEGTDVSDKTAKLVEKRKVWTTALLKTALGLVGLEKSGDRDAMCHRLMAFLCNPEKASRKRKAPSAVGTDESEEEDEPIVKKARKERSKKDKKVAKISGYSLFCKATREVLKAKEPELAFGEVGKRLGEAWKALSDEARQEWMDQATVANEEADEKKEKKAKKSKKEKKDKKDKKEKKKEKKEKKKEKKEKKDKKKEAEESSDNEEEGENEEGADNDEEVVDNGDASESGSEEGEDSGAEEDAFAESDKEEDEAEL